MNRFNGFRAVVLEAEQTVETVSKIKPGENKTSSGLKPGEN